MAKILWPIRQLHGLLKLSMTNQPITHQLHIDCLLVHLCHGLVVSGYKQGIACMIELIR